MYLKKIIAHGFKSFAEKINIDFHNGISGIVGPNGSGKSNVVDAVRWVLGEQSVKSLRGDGTMTDVIFSGSKSRKEAGSASVTLIFDNQDHYLSIALDEVAVKRRVYKDGTNEYFLNGERCRLKDITDIFLDSGVGRESFNIISQGKIEEILSNRPQDRRALFEEAAGVLKYKKRKEEALRKLDRTHQNMIRIEDIIRELEVQVEPLKKQKEDALLYQQANEELKEIEVALLAKEISTIHYQREDQKNRIIQLKDELLKVETTNTTNQSKVVASKTKLDQLDTEIQALQIQLIESTKQAEQLNSQKQLLLERMKYQTDDPKLHAHILTLKKDQALKQNDVNRLAFQIEQQEAELQTAYLSYQTMEEELTKEQTHKREIDLTLCTMVRQKASIDEQIQQLQDRIEQNSSLPYAVRQVLNHPSLTGIHHAFGKLIEIKEPYLVAITTVLGMAISHIVVDDERSAKVAIDYLKNTKSGRATFFPLTVIKSRTIDQATFSLLENQPGYLGVAASFVEYDKQYQDIVFNQLGNVIVVDSLDHANQIHKKTSYRYRIVTLDAELLHVGGSLTGGKAKQQSGIMDEQHQLDTLLLEQRKLIDNIKAFELQINQVDQQIRKLEDQLYIKQKTYLEWQQRLSLEVKQLELDKETLKQLDHELSHTDHITKQTINEEEERLLKQYYEEISKKERIELELVQLQKNKQSLHDVIEVFEHDMRKENSVYQEKNKELQQLEIVVNRAEVKLDHALQTLNETYHLTYEKATSLYQLQLDEKVARSRSQSLKLMIHQLGIVNLGAIEEYDRISERYEFLLSQRNDLSQAKITLLNIIDEMDQVMIKEFSKTFDVVRKHFQTTFQELFDGGTSDLKLTDPNQLLETGIDIIASPPGKKLTSISLLSGGEKTFTAIALLFAILRSRPVPFCILDEVEAALDEVNVDRFGKYLLKMKEKTQFILITHKKKTMEYVDLLYGITMQESGVSKLVSVKLEDLS